MFLTHAICKEDGKEVAWIDTRTDAQATVALCGQRTGSLSVHLDETDVAGRVHPNRARVKTWLHKSTSDPPKELLLNNLIVEPEAVDDTLTIPSVDVTGRLLNASYAPLPTPSEDTEELWTNEEQELGELMWALIHRSDKRGRELEHAKEMGIIRGAIDFTFETRPERFADGDNTWDRLVKESSKKNAHDFEFEPVDRDDGKFAKFNAYLPKQGENKREEIILEYGHNLSGLRFRPIGADLCNRLAVVGAPGNSGRAQVYVAEARESMGRYGVYAQTRSARGSSNMNELKREAEGFVAMYASPSLEIEVTMPVSMGGTVRGFSRNALGELIAVEGQYGIPPAFGPGGDFDFWIGDTITIRSKRHIAPLAVDKDEPGPDSDVYLRVTDATYDEVDEFGNVAVTLRGAPLIHKPNVDGYESVVLTKGN